MATITGGCMFGAVRYECKAQPAFMANCHCRDCLRATGAAYFPTVWCREMRLKSPANQKTTSPQGEVDATGLVGTPNFVMTRSATKRA